MWVVGKTPVRGKRVELYGRDIEPENMFVFGWKKPGLFRSDMIKGIDTGVLDPKICIGREGQQ